MTTIDAELAAMKRIVTALETLDPAARERVVAWVADRYSHTIGSAPTPARELNP